MAQAHDFADGADGGLTIAANAAKTVYDANGVPALAGAGHVSHDEGTGANPHLLLVGAAEQVCEYPVSFGNWTSGGVTLTDLGQDGIFRKGRMQSNGQSWHAARDWNGTNDLVLSANDEFTITWWFDETTRTMSPRLSLRGGGGFFNINGVGGSGGIGLSNSSDYTFISTEFEEVRADMWRKSVTARANAAMTIEGLTIEARTTSSAPIADLYGAQITNLGYYDGAIAGYSRAADVITALSVSAQTAGALVARYDALHGSGDIIGLRSNAAPARRMAIARNETANQIQAVAHDGTTEIVNLGATQTDTIKHVAFGFDQDDFGASIDNAAALTDTAGTFGALDELYIGDGPGVLKLYAYSLLDDKPSNADLATLVAGEAPAAGTTVEIGLASETSAGQALSATKLGALGIGGASELAQPLAAEKIVALLPALGTDQAQAIGAITLVELGLASESASAFALTSQRTAELGIAVTLDEAPALGSAVLAQIGLASEAASAIGMTAGKAAGLTPALDIALGFSVSASKASALGQAQCTDLPLALSAQLTALVPSARRTHVAEAANRTVIV